ncbi:unnamed protein product, partial [Prorocentrum cordatum]
MGTAALFNSRALPVLSYLAQFAMLPHEYFKNERWINATVLRFPNGAFRIKDWPHLRAWGVHGPRFLQLTMVAAIIRSAAATFSKFPETRARLHEGLNLYDSNQTLMGVARGALHHSPPRWQMPPFVEMLRQVASSTTEHVYYPANMLRPAVAGALDAIDDGRPDLAQRRACAGALPALGPDSIGPFLEAGIVAELPHYAEFHYNPDIFSKLRAAMSRLPPSWAAAWMRAPSFSWLTSSRIIHPLGKKKCIFGCRLGHGTLRRYLSCAPLARAVAKLGLTDMTSESIEPIVVTCNMYHNLRGELYVSEEAALSVAKAALRASKSMRTFDHMTVLRAPTFRVIIMTKY